MKIRPAIPADAGGVLAIYGPVVRDSWISFETRVPSVGEMARRIRVGSERHPWFVAEDDGGTLLGYAYGTPFRSRPAYRWSVEVSAYVREDRRGRGVGRSLYTALLDELRRRGFVTALAGIALPNPPSVAFHEGFGFEPVGILRNVGFKLSSWRDVGWWSLQLLPPPEAPREPGGSGRP